MRDKRPRRCPGAVAKSRRVRGRRAIHSPERPDDRYGTSAEEGARGGTWLVPPTQKCTEPAALSSGSPTDHSPKGVAARRTLNLRRFQLGATATLGGRRGAVKGAENALHAICECFLLRSVRLRLV